MDKKTAEIILDLNQFETPLEAYENQLFKLRNYIFLNPVVPKVLYAKLKKNDQLKEAIQHFMSPVNQFSSFTLNPLQGEHLFDKFIIYEENKSLIKRNLSVFLSSKNIDFGIHQLILNLLMWTEEIKDIDTENAADIPVTKELDVLKMYQMLKEIKENSSTVMSSELLSEFKRAQTLSKTIRS